MAEVNSRFMGRMSLRSSSEHLGIYDVIDAADELYLCGHKLTKYLEYQSAFFLRLQNYLETGLCFELAGLAMMMLKNVCSAKIQQGYIYSPEGKKLRHAWVEFIKRGAHLVADFAYEMPAIVPAHIHMRNFPKREVEWTCTHRDFWQLPLSNSIYEAMQRKETSYVFEDLEAYGVEVKPGETEAFGFQKHVMGKACDPEYFLPYERGNGIISEAVFDNLIEHPDHLEPSEEVLLGAKTVLDTISTINMWSFQKI